MDCWHPAVVSENVEPFSEVSGQGSEAEAAYSSISTGYLVVKFASTDMTYQVHAMSRAVYMLTKISKTETRMTLKAAKQQATITSASVVIFLNHMHGHSDTSPYSRETLHLVWKIWLTQTMLLPTPYWIEPLF